MRKDTWVPIPEWIMSPEFDAPPSARLLLVALLLLGIRKQNYLEISQRDLAASLGVSETSVANYLKRWEELKILQVLPGEIVRNEQQQVMHRKPSKILWLSEGGEDA